MVPQGGGGWEGGSDNSSVKREVVVELHLVILGNTALPCHALPRYNWASPTRLFRL